MDKEHPSQRSSETSEASCTDEAASCTDEASGTDSHSLGESSSQSQRSSIFSQSQRSSVLKSSTSSASAVTSTVTSASSNFSYHFSLISGDSAARLKKAYPTHGMNTSGATSAEKMGSHSMGTTVRKTVGGFFQNVRSSRMGTSGSGGDNIVTVVPRRNRAGAVRG